MIKLRFHHLLCLYYFKGYGYDEAFVKNMKEIKERINDEKIMVISSFDDLCFSCPNKGKSCRWEEKVLKYDKNIQNLTNINEGDILTYKEILAKLDKVIKSGNRMHACDDCKWSTYCK